MRTLLVLAALGWIISLPWATLFAYFALIVIAIVVMWLISVSIERRTISSRSKSRAIDHHYVAALESMVAEAETQVEALRGEVEQLRASCPVSEPDPKVALFGASDSVRLRRNGWSWRRGAPTARSFIPIVTPSIENNWQSGVSRRPNAYSTQSLATGAERARGASRLHLSRARWLGIILRKCSISKLAMNMSVIMMPT